MTAQEMEAFVAFLGVDIASLGQHYRNQKTRPIVAQHLPALADAARQLNDIIAHIRAETREAA